MYYRFFGQRNPEKDIERILVDLQGSGGIPGNINEFFYHSLAGYDSTNTQLLSYPLSVSDLSHAGLELVEAASQVVVSPRILVPSFTTGSANVKSVIVYDGSGDIYCRHTVNAWYCNVSTAHAGSSQSYAAITLSSQAFSWAVCISSYDFSNISAGDYLRIGFNRDATHGSDTYSGGNVWHTGFHVTF